MLLWLGMRRWGMFSSRYYIPVCIFVSLIGECEAFLFPCTYGICVRRGGWLEGLGDKFGGVREELGEWRGGEGKGVVGGLVRLDIECRVQCCSVLKSDDEKGYI